MTAAVTQLSERRKVWVKGRGTNRPPADAGPPPKAHIFRSDIGQTTVRPGQVNGIIRCPAASRSLTPIELATCRPQPPTSDCWDFSPMGEA